VRTPTRIIWNQFQASVRTFYDGCCRQVTTSERPVCRKCSAEIATIVAFMAVDDERLRDSCAAPGRTWQLPIPYCPRCEDKLAIHGCIHVVQAFTSSQFRHRST
jgi:hypothetical protein